MNTARIKPTTVRVIYNSGVRELKCRNYIFDNRNEKLTTNRFDNEKVDNKDFARGILPAI